MVTGASSGIGVDFARQLAARGMNLVITARRKERLETLASELRDAHEVEVVVVAADLSAPASGQELFDRTEGTGQPIDVLINNAGFGTLGPFLDIPWETSDQQMQLNLRTLTQLTHLFGKQMKARNHGYILNVSSIGAYLPAALYATYAAGKAYVRNFSEALAYELRDTGVRVCCLCPGGTRTEFMEVAGHKLPGWQQKFLMPSDTCARIGLRALFAGRRNFIAGVMNSIMMFTLRFLPRRAVVWLAARVMAPAP